MLSQQTMPLKQWDSLAHWDMDKQLSRQIDTTTQIQQGSSEHFFRPVDSSLLVTRINRFANQDGASIQSCANLGNMASLFISSQVSSKLWDNTSWDMLITNKDTIL